MGGAQPSDASSQPVHPTVASAPGAHQQVSILTAAKSLLADLRPHLLGLGGGLRNIQSVFTCLSVKVMGPEVAQ